MQRLFRLKPLLLAGLLSLSVNTLADVITIPTIEVDAPIQKSTATTGNTLAVSASEMKAQGSFSVTDWLQKQGLVQIKSHSSQQNQTSISMHGFGQNATGNNLVLVDGIPMASFTDIAPNVNSILIDNIASLSIKLGSYGVLYGNQAVGGVLNIVTRVPETAITKATVGIGNLAQKTAQVFLSRRLGDDVAVSVGGLAYHTNHDTLHNLQNNYNLNAALDYHRSQDDFKITTYTYKTDIELPAGKIWGSDAPSPISRSTSNQQGATVNLINDLHLTPDFSWKSALSGSGETINGLVNVPFETRQQNLLWHNRFSYRQWLLSGFDLQGQQYTLDNTLAHSKAHAVVSDFFAQATMPLVKKLDLVLGGRFAYQSLSASPTPGEQAHSDSAVPVNTQGLVWHVTNDWRAYVRRDTNYRFATADEKVWVSTNVRDLKTQTGTAYESGLKWQHDQNSAFVDVYQLDLNNEIAFVPEAPGAPFGKMSNLPPTRRLGADLALNLLLRQHWMLGFQSALVDPFFRSGVDKGNRIPGVSLFNAATSLTYERPTSFSINVTETYQSDFYAYNDLANTGPKMPGYFLTNLNITKQWKIFSLGLEIDNLWNKQYVRYAVSYPSVSQQIQYFSADGITALLTLTVNIP